MGPDAEKRRRFYRIAAELLHVGFVFPAAIALGYAVGYFLDKWWGTGPWMVVTFCVLGAAAGFVNLFRLAARLEGGEKK